MDNLRKFAREYLLSRKKFRDLTDRNPLLSGNDNLVGRIGEFVAVQFLLKQFKRVNVVRNPNPVEKGYDIIADGKRVSVKAISSENSKGRTTPIKEPWDELILVELGGDSRVLRIGYLRKEDFKKWGLFKPGWEPVASRSMFNKDGLISKLGQIFTGDAVVDLL